MKRYIALPILLSASLAQAGTMYVCKSEDGSTSFSDKPCTTGTELGQGYYSKGTGRPSNASDMVNRANRFETQRQQWKAESQRGRSTGYTQTNTSYQDRIAKEKHQRKMERIINDKSLTSSQKEQLLNVENANHLDAQEKRKLERYVKENKMSRSQRDLMLKTKGVEPASPPPTTFNSAGADSGVMFDQHGNTYTKTPGGAVDHRTGQFLPKAGQSGYTDPNTGKFLPAH
jgi:hypothetical protein